LILLANFSRWRRSSDASRAAGHFLAESRPPIQVMCLRANGGPVRDLILKRARSSVFEHHSWIEGWTPVPWQESASEQKTEPERTQVALLRMASGTWLSSTSWQFP